MISMFPFVSQAERPRVITLICLLTTFIAAVTLQAPIPIQALLAGAGVIVGAAITFLPPPTRRKKPPWLS